MKDILLEQLQKHDFIATKRKSEMGYDYINSISRHMTKYEVFIGCGNKIYIFECKNIRKLNFDTLRLMVTDRNLYDTYDNIGRSVPKMLITDNVQNYMEDLMEHFEEENDKRKKREAEEKAYQEIQEFIDYVQN